MSDFLMPGSRARPQAPTVGSGPLSIQGGLAVNGSPHIALSTALGNNSYTALYAPDGTATSQGIFLGSNAAGGITFHRNTTSHHFDNTDGSVNWLAIGSGTLSLNLSTTNTISLTGTTSNLINFGANGIGAPTFTSRSAGTKIMLWDNLDGSHVGYGIGIEGGVLWFSATDTSTQMKWYHGTTNTARLDGSGNFVCNALWLNAPSGSILADRVTNYHRFYDYDGNTALYLGGSSDKQNYYRNTAHAFGNIGGGSSYLLLNSTGGWNQFYNGEQRFYTAAGVANASINSSAGIYNPTDNASACGFSGLRWTAVWAVNGSIQTSDATAKEIGGPISDAELRAASRVKPKLFRMADQVAKKGDAARHHYGYTSQDWIEAYEAEGLDPWKHGAFCRDLIGQGGERFTVAAHHEHHHAPPEVDDGIEREYQLSLRYDQCLVLMNEYLSRRVDTLENRLAKAEQQLVTLLSK